MLVPGRASWIPRSVLFLLALVGLPAGVSSQSVDLKPSKDLLVVTDLVSAPVQVVTDRGAFQSSMTGQIRWAKPIGTSERNEPFQALLLVDAVPWSGGSTGALTVWIEQGRPQVSIPVGGSNLALQAAGRGALTYDAIDQQLGFDQFDDYTESYTEGFDCFSSFSGTIDPSLQQYQGVLDLALQVTTPLLGAVQSLVFSGPMTVSTVPAQLTARCPKEICIEISYADAAAKTAWAGDVEKMIDDADALWKACGIRVRTKVSPKEKCIPVVLQSTQDAGGGGLCFGKRKGGNANVTMGHNVVDDCAKKGVTTTFGQVLAHELGHALGLPQAIGSGTLMDNCAPSTTLTAAQCKEACKQAVTTPSIEDQAEGARLTGRGDPEIFAESFDLTNGTGKDANDLHLDFVTQAWVDEGGPFKSDAGSASSDLDFGRGEVKAGTKVTIKLKSFVKNLKLRKNKSYWTLDGQNIGGI